MKRSLCILICLLSLSSAAAAQQQPEPVESVDCPVDVAAFRSPVECFYVSVPEDHAVPDRPQIKLAVAVMHSLNANTDSTPLLFLQGGPGAAAIYPMLSQPGQLALLAALLENRDLILLDQRGIGMSQPQLDCPELNALFETIVPGAANAEQEAAAIEGFLTCFGRHATHGINLTAYTTRQIAADVAALVPALGYEQVDLYGVSYGTRAALTVMRDHPEVVRRAILNATLPMNVDLAQEEGRNIQHSFENMFSACRAQFWCHLVYPDLETVFYAVYDQLQAQPLQLEIQNAKTGQTFDYVMDGDRLMEALFNFLYQPEGIAAVPGLLYELHQGDSSTVKKRLEMALANNIVMPPSGRSSEIMSLEVMCSDIVPFIQRDKIPVDLPPAFRSVGIFQSPRLSLCDEIMTADIDQSGDQAVHSDIPTLILSGRYDHVTPASWGERAAETLPNSVVVTLANQSHGVRGVCVDEITQGFLDNPPGSALPTDCLADERPIQFLIVPAGTRLLVSTAMLSLGVVIVGWSAYAARHVRRRPQLSWRYTLQIVGWLPLAFAVLILAFVLLTPEAGEGMDAFQKSRVIETIIPLAMAIQAALLLAPDDEPALELLLTYPRPVAWLLSERLLVVGLCQGLIAVIGSIALLRLQDGDLGLMLLRWIPPALLLTGFALNAAIRSRRAIFGVVSVILLWFVFAIFGEAFLPGQPVFFPLNYLQPLMWPLHIFLQPGDLLDQDYMINRLFVLVAGAGLIVLALAYVRDTERLLLGKSALRKNT